MLQPKLDTEFLDLVPSQINLVPILIGNQLSGDVLHNVGLGYALAMGMVAILGITLIAYSFLQRRSERWSR